MKILQLMLISMISVGCLQQPSDSATASSKSANSERNDDDTREPARLIAFFQSDCVNNQARVSLYVQEAEREDEGTFFEIELSPACDPAAVTETYRVYLDERFALMRTVFKSTNQAKYDECGLTEQPGQWAPVDGISCDHSFEQAGLLMHIEDADEYWIEGYHGSLQGGYPSMAKKDHSVITVPQ
jgi:hypothetical protein